MTDVCVSPVSLQPLADGESLPQTHAPRRLEAGAAEAAHPVLFSGAGSVSGASPPALSTNAALVRSPTVTGMSLFSMNPRAAPTVRSSTSAVRSSTLTVRSSPSTVHEVRGAEPLPAAYVQERERRQRLARLAAERGVSVSDLARDAAVASHPYGEPIPYFPNDSAPSDAEDRRDDAASACGSVDGDVRGALAMPDVVATPASLHLVEHASGVAGSDGGRAVHADPNAAVGLSPGGDVNSLAESSDGEARAHAGSDGELRERTGLSPADCAAPPLGGCARASVEDLFQGAAHSVNRLTSSYDGHTMVLDEHGSILNEDGTLAVRSRARARAQCGRASSEEGLPMPHSPVMRLGSAASPDSISLRGSVDHLPGGDSGRSVHATDDEGAVPTYSLGIPMATVPRPAVAHAASSHARVPMASSSSSPPPPHGSTDGSSMGSAVNILAPLSLSELEARAVAGPATGTVLIGQSFAEHQRLLERRERQRLLVQDRLLQLEGMRQGRTSSVLPGRVPPATGKHPRRCACGGYRTMGRGVLEPYCLQRKDECLPQ